MISGVISLAGEVGNLLQLRTYIQIGNYDSFFFQGFYGLKYELNTFHHAIFL